jgi:preprotein translocase subunit SecG
VVRRGERATLRPVEVVLSALQIFFSVILIVLILLHSGKDAGLSGAFGVGAGGGRFGGGALLERNLTRWTIAFGILFVLNVIILLKL